MASFPTATKSFTTKNNGGTIDAAHVNDLQDEVTAIETNLRGGSTGQVYLGGATPGFSSTIALHRVESSQFSVSGASTLGTIQAGNSTFGTLQASNGTLANLQISSNCTVAGNLVVTGTISNAGIPQLLKSSTFATNSTTIADLSTITVTGLTQLDTLEFVYSVEASTTAINNFRLRNKTDGVTVLDLNDQAGTGDMTGGQSAFGIVTALEFDLVAVPEFYGGALFYTGHAVVDVLHAFSAWAPTLPEDVTTSVAILRLPPVDADVRRGLCARLLR